MWTISTNGDLGTLQLVSELVTGLVSRRARLAPEWEQGLNENAKLLGGNKGDLSHIGWRGERSPPYKWFDTSR